MRRSMARTLHITLTGVPGGAELDAVVTLTRIKPMCLDYTSATALVFVDGEQRAFETVCLTDETALKQVARWFVDKFGATSATKRAEFWPSVSAA